MVWYIRFLKPPKLDQKGHVRTLITITTDLGDDFYPTDLIVHAVIQTAHHEGQRMSEWQTVNWESGMRALWIELRDVHASPAEPLRLVVNSRRISEGVLLALNDLPEILGVWSDTFGGDKAQAGSIIERRYRTDSGSGRTIAEETGESIARHIWDAGIALTALLSTIALQPRPTSDLSEILQRSISRGPRILELGSGCGIVGLQLADLCSTSDVLLTDLQDTMGILNHNAEHVKVTSSRAKITTAVLDWNEPLPGIVAKQQFDLVVVSDCTYNPDSIPGLVKTLNSVAEVSPDALIVVALKVRHDSEAIFFDSMAGADFVENEHTAISLPDRCRSDIGQELEAVQVYVYCKRRSAEDS